MEKKIEEAFEEWKKFNNREPVEWYIVCEDDWQEFLLLGEDHEEDIEPEKQWRKRHEGHLISERQFKTTFDLAQPKGYFEAGYKAGDNHQRLYTDTLASALERLIKEAGTYCADCDVIIYDIGNHNADHSLSSTGAVAEAKKALKGYKDRITWG